MPTVAGSILAFRPEDEMIAVNEAEDFYVLGEAKPRRLSETRLKRRAAVPRRSVATNVCVC